MKYRAGFIYAMGFCIFIGATSNIPSVSLAIMVMMNDKELKKTNYHYSSAGKNRFSVWSRKGHDDVMEQFDYYKKSNPRDTVLYRNFKPVLWKVWRWNDYLTEPGYKLPYRELPHDAYLVSRGISLPRERLAID